MQQADGLAIGFLTLLTLVVFLNSLNGEFVYDDRKQIVTNQFIQDGSFVGEALLSDVWAFKGDREEAWSNYWRPTFVSWLMVQYRLFGLEGTFGWHFSNLLLHLIVVFSGFLFLKRLGASRSLATAALAIFAVHPTKVESVAWISGSPDMLLGLFFLTSLILALKGREQGKLWTWTLSGICALLAMLAKEVGIVLPVVLFAIWVVLDIKEGKTLKLACWSATKVSLPFLGIALLYFVARYLVLGTFTKQTAWDMGLLGIVLNGPAVFVFYLRQALAPIFLGPSYPLRAMTPETLAWDNFALPLVFCLLFAGFLIWAIRRNNLARVGAVLFLFPLLPVFNINAFAPEQLVHDRYLYLPLLGFWLMILARISDLLAGVPKWNKDRAGAMVLKIAMVYVLLVSIQTVVYNRAWTSELKLWEWGVRSDPTSGYNWAAYGAALKDAGRAKEAKAALTYGNQLRPLPNTLLNLAEIAIKENRFDDGEAYLKEVLAYQPDNGLAYERLALCYQESNRLHDAIDILRKGMVAAPHQTCSFAANLGVALYLTGDKPGALRELERVRDLVADEISAPCRNGLFHLAKLYLEQGRVGEARDQLRRYLDFTQSVKDETTLRFRQSAQQILKQIGGV